MKSWDKKRAPDGSRVPTPHWAQIVSQKSSKKPRASELTLPSNSNKSHSLTHAYNSLKEFSINSASLAWGGGRRKRRERYLHFAQSRRGW